MVHWLRFCTFTAGGVDLIPGQGTKILHAPWDGQKKKWKEQNWIWRGGGGRATTSVKMHQETTNNSDDGLDTKLEEGHKPEACCKNTAKPFHELNFTKAQLHHMVLWHCSLCHWGMRFTWTRMEFTVVNKGWSSDHGKCRDGYESIQHSECSLASTLNTEHSVHVCGVSVWCFISPISFHKNLPFHYGALLLLHRGVFLHFFWGH